MTETLTGLATDTPPAPPRRLRPNAKTCFVVRDARGVVRFTGRTKAKALAPYRGAVAKSVVYNSGASVAPLRKSTLWQFLYRRGWRCALEPKPTTTLPSS